MSSVLYLYEDRAVLEAGYPDCERCEKLLGLTPEDDESVPAVFHIKNPTYWEIYRVICLMNPEVIGV